jgi:LPXTG-motif cell wall-anchored protein
MTALRRLSILAALGACLLVVGTGIAMAGEDEPQETTTTTIGEGPTEVTVTTTDPNVSGPEAEELPDTGAGSEMFLIVIGAALITAGMGSGALAVRASRR